MGQPTQISPVSPHRGPSHQGRTRRGTCCPAHRHDLLATQAHWFRLADGKIIWALGQPGRYGRGPAIRRDFAQPPLPGPVILTKRKARTSRHPS